MRPRTLTLLLALPLAATLAACSSTTAGAGSTGSAPAPDAGSASSGQPAGAAAALRSALERGTESTRSAAFSQHIETAGNSVDGRGVEKLSGGRLSALRLTEDLPGRAGRIGIVYAGGHFYIKLPSTLRGSGKPWGEATANSSNPVLRKIYSSVQQYLSAAAPSSVSQYLQAQSSVRDDGTSSVDGARVTRYTVVVDVAKLPASFPNIAAVKQAGISKIPVVVYIDDQGRPRKITENFTAAGQSVSVVMSIGNFNRPVSISAPPASEVGH